MTNKKEALEALDELKKWAVFEVENLPEATHLEELYSTIRAVLESMQWKPIETAPKDGSAILVFIKSPVTKDKWQQVVSYNDIENMFMQGSMTVGHDFITHWMPLPTPPESEEV